MEDGSQLDASVSALAMPVVASSEAASEMTSRLKQIVSPSHEKKKRKRYVAGERDRGFDSQRSSAAGTHTLPRCQAVQDTCVLQR